MLVEQEKCVLKNGHEFPYYFLSRSLSLTRYLIIILLPLLLLNLQHTRAESNVQLINICTISELYRHTKKKNIILVDCVAVFLF